jgi:antitoxin component YwqK of YwqJK toxin-antitoxin module
MKIFSLITLFLLVCSCSKDKPKDVLQSQIIPKIYTSKSSSNISTKNNIVFLNDKEYSGFIFQLYENSDTAVMEGYYNGLLSGVQKKWYPNKQLMEERYYLGSQKNGKQVAYWENGNKKFEFVAKNDAYEGEMKEWTLEGKLFHLATYKNGQEEGAQKMWYDNGKIRANYVIMNGKRYGLLGTKNCKNVSDSIFIVK